MERIVIQRPNGSTLKLYGKTNLARITRGEQRKKLLGENTVELTVRSAKPLELEIGDKITVFSEDYYLNLLPEAKKTSSREYEYNLTFESAQYELAKVMFLDEDGSGLSTSTNFTLRANLEEIGRIIINNLNRVYGTGKWVLYETPAQTTDVRDFSYSENNCLAVLQKACEEYGTEFKITTVVNGGNTTYRISIKKIGSVVPYTFQYGHNKGLYGIKRKTVNSENIVTRLYAFGGSQNLPGDYRNYSSRLRLPDTDGENTSYIEDLDAIAAFGIIEGAKLFEDIYPKYEGTVTAIDASDILSFTDSAFPFNLNELDGSGNTKYLLDGISAKITFNTGALAGYTFEVKSYDHATKTFKLLKYEDDRGFVYPSVDTSTFRIAATDKYILSDINPPQSYITAAENALLAAAQEYLNENKAPRVNYDIDIAEEYLAKIAGPGAVVNIFDVGDYVGIKDSEINIDRTGESSIRIIEMHRDLCSATHYDYTISVSDTLEVNVIERLIAGQKDTENIINLNNLTDVSKLQRSWRSTQELLNMVFDPEGYFDTANIKPASIETAMLSVGAKSQQFTLQNTVLEANYEGNANKIRITGGVLIHYGLTETTTPTWTLGSRTETLVSTAANYIYARCLKAGSTGEIIFDTAQHNVEEGSYYYFIIGVLHSVDTTTNTRWISLTYGATSVNGRYIKTGRIQSADGSCYFDLDNNEIHGTITFTKNGQNYNIADLQTQSSEAYNYITNTLPGILSDIQAQLDGQIEQFFETYDPTTSNAPANTWTTTQDKENHLGDLFYNTSTGKVFRWVKESGVYKWQELQDSEVAEALALANSALALAGTKRRIFTTTPYPPYEVGDLWVNGTDIKYCINARATGSYVSTDWDKASNYTDDSALTSFVNTTFAALVTQVDGKIESWFGTTDPSTNWTTAALKSAHVGDLWYNTSTKILKRYNVSGSTYSWGTIEDAAAIAAAEAASQAQDTADGKRTVFTTTPYTPYSVGDLWTNGTDLKVCNTARATGSYVASDWGLATNYDHTKTVIDGGLITSGTIQLAGDNNYILAGITGQGSAGTSVRIWAGATFDNRAVAPFRVNQNGEVFARYRIELQDTNNNGLAGICGQGTDGTDSKIRFWAGATYANRASAPFWVKSDGSLYCTKATLANGCKVGGWDVSNSGIFNDTGDAYLIARKAYGDGKYTEARVGASVFPASSGASGCGYFINTRSAQWDTNYGIIIDVENAAYNIALGVTGDVVVNGLNVSRKHKVTTATASSWHYMAYDAEIQIISCTVDTAWFVLPDRYSVANHLGIGSSTPFSVPYTIIGRYQTSGAKQFKIWGYSTSHDNIKNVRYPKWLNNNATIQNGEINMNEGDILTFQLVYDGSNYFAYLVNSRT